MGFLQNLVTYVQTAADVGIGTDKAAIAYWECRPFVMRVLKGRYSNALHSVRTKYGTFHFRDNWGDVKVLTSLRHPDYDLDGLNETGIFVDAGANIGQVSAVVAARYPKMKIICFEPLADVAAITRMNVPSAEVLPFGLGEKESTVTLLVDEYHLMASKNAYDYPQQRMEFGVKRLDEVLKGYPGTVACIKIDVEGMELEVLRGASVVLDRTERVVCEVHAKNLQPVTELLAAAGFGVQRKDSAAGTTLLTARRTGRAGEPPATVAP